MYFFAKKFGGDLFRHSLNDLDYLAGLSHGLKSSQIFFSFPSDSFLDSHYSICIAIVSI